ncbi:hypothetical protein GCM10023063_11840 [Arthrobacter methylotrophus]|uniref:glycosyltransferase n=1 Tax=Arthrobacter methylotrophus TaxID=121291 RepID=UPI0031EFF7DC
MREIAAVHGLGTPGLITEVAATAPLYGVSVIVPSFMGSDRIAECLDSLEAQDLDPKSFEVIVVMNGPDDGTIDVARRFSQRFPLGHLRLIKQSLASAGAARNFGLALARFSFVTMVDDDDRVGRRFLSSMLKVAGPGQVAIAPIIDVHPDGTWDRNNALNKKIFARAGKPFVFSSASDLIGFNACKLIPAAGVKDISYSESLRSGEDICFMAEVAVLNSFTAQVGSLDEEAAYFRVLRNDSISRKPLDFDFAVAQRLAVIEKLEECRSWDSGAKDSTLKTLVNAQANFLRRYLDLFPEERDRVVEAIDASAIKDFPWPRINDGYAKDLAISYCFSPFADTSAVIAAKTIAERSKIVDVISNDMSAVRKLDSNIETIAARFIDKMFVVDAPVSFAGWDQISEFVSRGIAVADRQDALNGGYETMYSRVLWAGSHFLGAMFKVRHPAVIWSAEFSDPLSFDSQGLPRAGDLKRDGLFEVLDRAVRSKGYSGPNSDNLFVWCEYISYVLADELIFTNENQLEYMLSKVDEPKLQNAIRSKAVVRVHPTPPARSYGVVPSEYSLSGSVVNIGYFGAFYENRGLFEVLTALMNAPLDIRRGLRLHVFTNKPEFVEKQALSMGLTGIVKTQSYRPYLEFLNLATRFDVLLVNDVERAGELAINPFLPSKYSDYKGSGVAIWGLVDGGSALSREPLRFKSGVGNGPEALVILGEIFRTYRRDRGN